MKKIILIAISISFLNSGIFGDTPEEKAIAKIRLKKLFVGMRTKETIKIQKENQELKKLLKKRHINYEYPMKNMRREENIKKIKNFITITEKREIYILKKENQELKRIININGITIEKKNQKNIKYENVSETIIAKKNLKEQMRRAMKEVD